MCGALGGLLLAVSDVRESLLWRATSSLNTMGTTDPNATEGASSRLYSDYKTAWQSRATMQPAQQNSCLASVTKQCSSLTPKCQSLSGSAFDNCIRNTERQ